MAGVGGCSPFVEDFIDTRTRDRSIVVPTALTDEDQIRTIGWEMLCLATSVFEKDCEVSLILLPLLLLHH